MPPQFFDARASKGLAAGRFLRHDKPSPAQLGTAFGTDLT
jgi:hypothetical protein